MIRVWFYKGDGDILDKAIRIWQSLPKKDDGSKYSHSEIEINSYTYSADARSGKVIKIFKYHFSKDWDYIDVEASYKEEKEIIAFLESQVGKGYDYIGIFTAQILALPFDDPNRWFCSEYNSCALKIVIKELIHYNSWYNPRRLYNFLKQYTTEKRKNYVT